MEASKFKILVVGIGGVGGYFGGLLAQKYRGSEAVEVNFLSRGKNLEAIRTRGLKVREAGEEFTAVPARTVDQVRDLPKMDLVMVATKSYALEDAIRQIAPVVGPETTILPLLNGVFSKKIIEKIVPQATVLEGCVYIISQLAGPGIVEKTGKYQALHFGLKGHPQDKIARLNKLFLEAGIDSNTPDDIEKVIWEKYIFISTVATATSFFNCTIGEITGDPSRLAVTREMLEEIYRIGLAMKIDLREDMVEQAIKMMHSVPPGDTSSMHRDFLAGRETEVEILTGFIVKAGMVVAIPTPRFEEAYRKLGQM